MIVAIASSLGVFQIQTNVPGTVLQRLGVQIKQALNKDYNTLVIFSIAASGLGLGISVATLIAEALIVVLRFSNFTAINYKIKLFLGLVSTNITPIVCIIGYSFRM